MRVSGLYYITIVFWSEDRVRSGTYDAFESTEHCVGEAVDLMLCAPSNPCTHGINFLSSCVNYAAPPAAFCTSSACNFFQLPKKPMKVATPDAAIVIAKTAFNPTM
jgi:hypothetical protein